MADMVPFDWADPFNLDDQLTDEERMIRDAARGFAQSVLQPRVIEYFAHEADASELFPQMGEAGLLGVTVGVATSLPSTATVSGADVVIAVGEPPRSSVTTSTT